MKYLIALFLSCLSVVAWPVVGVTNVPYYFYVAPGANISVATNGTVYTISASGGNATNTMFVVAGTNTTVQTNGFTFTVNSTWPTHVAYVTGLYDATNHILIYTNNAYSISFNTLSNSFEFGGGVNVKAGSFEGDGSALTNLSLFRLAAGTNVTIQTNGLLYTVNSIDEISFTINTTSTVTNTFNGRAQYVTHVMDNNTLVNPLGTNNGAISFRFLTSTPRTLLFPTNWAWLSVEHFVLDNTNYTITVSNKIGYLSLVSFTPGVSNIVAKYLQP